MKKVRYSTQFRKDFKRYKNKPEKVDALRNLTKLFEEGKPIPPEYSPHPLSGKYKGFMECHIENNFLLIWFDESQQIVCFERLGTHHELFGI
ncbi:MAG: type II toxin-antitoxin system YafQ family toxin [Bacteroidaceae bacterium]|nr:type II toxin-antitoxin system YafQ family toxin [Bacteroidaceae bacterium]